MWAGLYRYQACTLDNGADDDTSSVRRTANANADAATTAAQVARLMFEEEETRTGQDRTGQDRKLQPSATLFLNLRSQRNPSDRRSAEPHTPTLGWRVRADGMVSKTSVSFKYGVSPL
jgi:hypothetical protein